MSCPKLKQFETWLNRWWQKKKKRNLFPHPDPLCVSLASSDQLSPSARRRPQRPHIPHRRGEVILTFCSFVSNTPNGTTPRSPPGVLFPFLFRLKSPTRLKVFYRFPLLQDEEGGRSGRRDVEFRPSRTATGWGGEGVFFRGAGERRQEGGQQMDGARSGGRKRSSGGRSVAAVLGLQALVGVMEPLSRVSGGLWYLPRPCTPTARLQVSATSPRSRIFLERIDEKSGVKTHVTTNFKHEGDYMMLEEFDPLVEIQM